MKSLGESKGGEKSEKKLFFDIKSLSRDYVI
jgi:hypothetical protein